MANKSNPITVGEWCEFIKRDYAPEIAAAFIEKYSKVSREIRITYDEGMRGLSDILGQLGHTSQVSLEKMAL